MDLTELLNQLNNHFEREFQDGTFVISSGSIDGIKLNCPALSYVQIIGSIMNDGVYQVDTFTNGLLGISGLKDETFTGTIIALSVPKDIINLVNEITDYEANQSKGITSESIPNYSVTFDQIKSNEKFAGKLSGYQKPYRGKFYFKQWATKIS
jgi:hypothetical protein